MYQKTHDILFINPWIYDFAAFDLWAKPLGLLYIAGLFRRNGYRVHYIDCLDIHHPDMKDGIGIAPPKRKSYKTGRFYKENIKKPYCLKDIPKRYSRYGITLDIFRRQLMSIPKPSVILVTSMMTYWYPGVFKAIEIVKEVYPEVPVVLGGIYATLCHSHALSYSKADYIIKGEGELEALRLVNEITGNVTDPLPDDRSLDAYPYPAFDLISNLDYVCILTSRGCPFSCTYCASGIICKGFRQRDPIRVAEEIEFWSQRYGVKEFAFYDDALMVEPHENIAITLEELIKRKVACNLHTPNGIHIRFLAKEVCELMQAAGFKTIRLGFETSDKHRQVLTGNKTTNEEFKKTVFNLRASGFLPEQIGVYILIGLPGQKPKEVEESIEFVRDVGGNPILAEYSPIPQTTIWEDAVRESRLDIAREPLFQNNSLVPFRSMYLSFESCNRLKQMTREKGRD